jgi:hypothetical protein
MTAVRNPPPSMMQSATVLIDLAIKFVGLHITQLGASPFAKQIVHMLGREGPLACCGITTSSRVVVASGFLFQSKRRQTDDPGGRAALNGASHRCLLSHFLADTGPKGKTYGLAETCRQGHCPTMDQSLEAFRMYTVSSSVVDMSRTEQTSDAYPKQTQNPLASAAVAWRRLTLSEL